MTPLLRGQSIRLTAITESDYPVVAAWYEDDTFLRLLDASPAVPQTVDQIKKWMEEGDQTRTYLFGVRLLETQELVGYVELGDILWNHGVAWIAIAIGRTHWRHGYGRETMRLLLDFAFSELNLRRVQLTVFEYNTPAIALYESLGFQREGSYREFIRRNGTVADMYLYGLLRREWEEASTGASVAE